MSLKSLILARLVAYKVSEKRYFAKRVGFERRRQKAGEPHLVEFFHDASDPYSQLLAKILPEFQARYDVKIKVWHISPPVDEFVPERQKLADYALIDSYRLAAQAGIDFQAKRITHAASQKITSSENLDADKRLSSLGHYMGGMLYYGGEWYWGLDRLHYLEDRLSALGLAIKEHAAPIFLPPQISISTDVVALPNKPVIDFFLSFRSPYTAIVADRVAALANAYNADLRLRFVLPMVMRNLPVPRAKGEYILSDTAREARRLKVPFGRICDPLGRPVERGYSLLPWAIEQGRGVDYVQAFLRSVWAEGVDANSNSGMRRIVEAVRLDWKFARKIIGNNGWRDEAEANRLEMMSLGVWGVPSFKIGDVVTWGQDRLWVIENELKKNRMS
ncbi:MAG: DsbA family protein [Candidatus Micropelagos thuwalensis]